MCNHSHELPPAQLSLSRRALVGTAWAAPAIYATTLVPAYAASPSQTQPPVLNGHANVVVVVRFAGDTVGDGQTGFNKLMSNNVNTYWQDMKQEFAPTGIPYVSSLSMPLKDYISKVSAGQWDVVTSYVQDPTQSANNIKYITLPYSLEAYPGTTDFNLVRDTMLAIKNLNPDTTNWDLDKDGLIDNLSIIVQLPPGQNAYNSGSFLVPHHSENPTGVFVNGMDVRHSLVLPAVQSSYGGYTIGSSNDTIKHEYLHTVGIWDLYRGGSVGQTTGDVPVGVWSIMAQANRNWPLAQERADLGWVNIPNVDFSQQKTQTITLHPQYSAAGSQAVRIPSPYGGNESFVIEYRQQAKKYSGQIDERIPASGAIVYRVNDKVNNTHQGHSNISLDEQSHDYIYVFRQDSENTTTGLKPATAVLNTTGISTYGSSDLMTTANTIKDSTGRNTGIVVKVLSQTADSITLEVTQADTKSVSLWEPVGVGIQAADITNGSLAASSTTISRLTMTSSSFNSFTASAQTLNGSTWTGIGSPFNGNYGEAQLAYLNDTLYAASPNYDSNDVEVKRFSNGQWSLVSAISGIGESPFFFGASNGNLYVSGSLKGGVEGRVYASQGSNFTQIGDAIHGQYFSNFAVANVNGSAELAVTDFFARTHQIYTLQNGRWVATQKDTSGLKTLSLLSNAGASYELLMDGAGSLKLRVLSASGQVQNTVTPTGLPATVSIANMAISGTTAAIVVESRGAISAYTASLNDLSSWKKLGENIANSSSTPEIEIIGSTVYVLFKDSNSQTINVSKHSL